MKKTKRYYVTPEGNKFPLFEAPYDYVIPVYKKDCKRAVIADPNGCLIALGAQRDPLVLGAYIGSGKDAYIVFRESEQRYAHALHFTISASAARVRDWFDTHKGEVKTTVKLSAPTAGRTSDSDSRATLELGSERRCASLDRRRSSP